MKNLFIVLMIIIIGCVSTQEKKEEPKEEIKRKKFNKEEFCKELNDSTLVDKDVREILCQ